MSTATLVAVLLLKAAVAAVLIGSGTAKLVQRDSDVDRGLPRVLALLDRRAGRIALGSVELALGAASILALGSPAVDVAVGVLCTGFFVGSAVLGATRPGTACQCFGAGATSSFGARHTALTGLLAASAAVAFVGALHHAGDPGWAWHPLMLATLAGLVILAARVRRLPDLAHRRPA